jgi:hypothetical protein
MTASSQSQAQNLSHMSQFDAKQNPAAFDTRLVSDGKVYRQLFEAQVCQYFMRKFNKKKTLY